MLQLLPTSKLAIVQKLNGMRIKELKSLAKKKRLIHLLDVIQTRPF